MRKSDSGSVFAFDSPVQMVLCCKCVIFEYECMIMLRKMRGLSM